VPLSFYVYSLVIVWYALHGYHPDDLGTRRRRQSWYRHKDDIASKEMLAKLRRTLVVERISRSRRITANPFKLVIGQSERQSRCGGRDFEEAVVLGHAFSPGGRTRFDLTAPRADRKIGDERVVSLAGAVRNHCVVA